MVAIASRKPIYKKNPEEFIFRRKLRFVFLRIFKLFKLVLSLTIVSFIIWSIWFDREQRISNFINESSKKVLIDAGFAIKKIEIYGNEQVSNDQILQAMMQNELSDISKYPIVMLSLRQVSNNLKDIKWIEKISIKKQLPDTVIINVKERQASALWQKNNKVWIADKKGVLIHQNISKYTNLPIIVGQNEEKDIVEVFDIMEANSKLHNQVTSFTKVGNRRWDAKLDNGILVKLPEKAPVKAWKKLAEFDQEKQLLAKNIKYIDMRIEGQLVVGLE